MDFSRIDSAGVPLDYLVVTPTGEFPHLASSDDGYIAFWQDSEIRAARITTVGELLDPNGIDVGRVANAQTKPAVASDGQNYVVVWQDLRAGTNELERVTIDGRGAASDVTKISNGNSPSIAYSASGYLIAWLDHCTGYNSACAQAVRVAPPLCQRG